jgi:hypothetical protein
MNDPGVINMQAAIKAMRIEAIIERLDDRGADLMCKAIKHCGGPRYEDYVTGIRIMTKPRLKRRSA